MRWDALLRPVGPLPASTYWARRVVVLLGLLAILIILIAVAAGGGSKPKAKTAATDPGIVLPSVNTSSSAAGSVSPSPSAATSGSSAPECPDSSLSISVMTGATRYPDGSLPQFVVSVTNTGTAPCQRDVGADARVLTVTSGSDRIWSSADCSSTAKDVRALMPGVAVTLPSSWNRLRSVVGCTTNPPAGEAAQVGVYVVRLMLGTLGPTAGANFNLS